MPFGSVARVEPFSVQFALDGTQVDPDRTTSAEGTGFGLFNADDTSLIYRLTVSGLDFGTIFDGFPDRITPDTTDDVTTAPIHSAARGANGGVAFAFLNDDDLTASLNADGSWTFGGVWEADEGLTPTIATALATTTPGTDVSLYWNIHTTSFPGGEIRGQFVSSANDTANNVPGTGLNDTLDGLGGDDTITASAGNDLLRGAPATTAWWAALATIPMRSTAQATWWRRPQTKASTRS